MEKRNNPVNTHEFVAELKHYKPRIWRRIQVTDKMSLEDLAYIVMNSFNCYGNHLYQVVTKINGKDIYYSVPNPYDDYYDTGEMKDIAEVKLSKVFKKPKDWITLEYDFGDGWEFKIQLEKKDILADKPEEAYPYIDSGKGYGIIEDCGGDEGLEEIADGLSKGTLDEEMIEWLQGQLDFEWDGKENFLVQFDKEAFNENNDDYTLLRAIYREQNDE